MNRTIFYALIATAFFIQMHHNYAAEVNQPSPNDGYTRSLIVHAKNGDSLELSPADLTALQSEYLKQLAAPEHGLSVESIAALPIATVRPLQLLLPGSQLAEARYDDVVEATSLADLLMIPNGVDRFLKRLGRENIKLLCQLYQDPDLEGQELVKDYISPYLPYKLTQRLGAVGNISDHPDVGHTGFVTSVALSPDGNTVISGSSDRTIIIWHRGEDGQFRFDPQRDRLGAVNNTDDHPDVGHTNWIISAALSPDGNTIISGSYDRTLIVWHRGEDGQFRFNPQRDRLGAVDNTDPAVGHINFITSVATSSDGNMIISGSTDRTLIVWHRGEDGQFRFDSLRDRLGIVNNIGDYPDIGHTHLIRSVAASSDGSTIVSGSDDRTIIVWHRGEDGLFHMVQRLGAISNRDSNIGHISVVESVTLSPDGDTIISGSRDSTLIVWHRDEDGQFRFDPWRDRLGAVGNTDDHPDVGHTGFVNSVVLSADGNTVISGSRDRTLIVWHRGEDGQFRFDPQRDRLGAINNTDSNICHTDWIRSIVLSADANAIISGSNDSTVIIWRKQSVDEFCVAQAQASEVGI